MAVQKGQRNPAAVDVLDDGSDVSKRAATIPASLPHLTSDVSAGVGLPSEHLFSPLACRSVSPPASA